MAGPNLTIDLTETRDAFFERIVHGHARLLYRVAHSVLRNPADAEDAVADALLKILRTGAWKGITNERAFLSRAVWRTAVDRFNARVTAPYTNTRDEVEPFDLVDGRSSPEQDTANREERRLLHKLIDRLPAELRDPHLLAAVEELNSREIGEILNLPEGTVRTRLMRARQQLRAQYETYETRTPGRGPAARG